MARRRAPTPLQARIWLTGPSGAGKTTVTNALLPARHGGSNRHRARHGAAPSQGTRRARGSRGKLLRKAFVSSEIIRHGGIVICVTVSTRRSVRTEARALVGSDHFIEVHFDLPGDRSRPTGAPRTAAVDAEAGQAGCRPVRGRLSGRARGYEAPISAEVTIDAASCTAEQGAQLILDALRARGILIP